MAKAASAGPAEVERRLIEFVAGFRHDPLGFARAMWPWSEPGPLAAAAGPRRWQTDILTEIGAHLANPANRHQPLRIAVSSGHGIGKSALIGMIDHWARSTCVDHRTVVTANTGVQLFKKTLPELGRWTRTAINAHWFAVESTSISARAVGHEGSWRTDGATWSEHNTEAFAGLHNQGRRILMVFDEASAIADKVFEVAEGALTDEGTEIIWLVFGNPTRNTGRFRECFGNGKFRHLWRTRQIDSRTVEGTNRAYLDGLVTTWGEDSDYVKVRVRGLFPSASDRQFISDDLVSGAMDPAREVHVDRNDPLIMGVDVARGGADGTVLRFRRGRDGRSIPPVRLRVRDTMEIAARVVEQRTRWGVDQIFVDGGGVGGGVCDRLRQLGVPYIEVQFGARADGGARVEGEVFANKRAEMWGAVRIWLKTGTLEDDPLLRGDLCGPEYGYVLRDGRDAILLESKDAMRDRGLSSPDDGDAFALTFAYPVTLASARPGPGQTRPSCDYDPFS